MKRLLLILLIFISFQSSFAQKDKKQEGGPSSAQLLRLARATYEQGRLHEVPSQLSSEIIGSMTKQDKVQAYTLLCLSYIYLEESDKADENMLNILLTDPYFKPNEQVDPAEFVSLYKTFRTDPIFRIGAKIGLTASRPNVTESVAAVELGAGSGYKYLIDFQFGVAADLPLYFIIKKLTFHSDLLFQQKKFQINLNVNRGVSTSGEKLINKFEGIESQTWLSLPLIFEYQLFDAKFNPYVGLGASFDYLVGSNITSRRSRENETSIEEKKYNFKPNREKLNISGVATAGVKMKLAGGFLVAETRFAYGLTNINSKKTAFANTQYTLEQGYADPIYKLTSLEVSVGYIQNIFKPKKLSRKK